tara:strand:+ start:281 stop:637 length:357 start_codon:yes stop_codon:yes gene_type:complete
MTHNDDGLLDGLRKRFAKKIDNAVRTELGESTRELDNVRTANQALRVELMTQHNLLAGAQAAIALLARGAANARAAHLDEMTTMIAQNADTLTECDELQAAMAELRHELVALKAGLGL